jgi:hypothetical protein
MRDKEEDEEKREEGKIEVAGDGVGLGAIT